MKSLTQTLEHARHLVEHGDIRAGLEVFRSVETELTQVSPTERARTLNEMGLCYFYTGRPDEALGYFRRALAENPKEISICNNVALAAHQTQDYASADEFFTRAMKLCDGEPTMVPVVVRVFATCLIDRSAHDRAIELLKGSIEQIYLPLGDAEDSFLYNQGIPFFDSHAIPLTIAFCQSKRYQNGLDYMIRLRRDLKGCDYMFDALIGILHANLAQFEAAAERYRKLSESQARDFNFGMLAARQERYDEASAEFEKVGPHLSFLGSAYLALKRNQDPTEPLRAFAAGQKQKAVSYLGLGLLDEGYALAMKATV